MSLEEIIFFNYFRSFVETWTLAGASLKNVSLKMLPRRWRTINKKVATWTSDLLPINNSPNTKGMFLVIFSIQQGFLLLQEQKGTNIFVAQLERAPSLKRWQQSLADFMCLPSPGTFQSAQYINSYQVVTRARNLPEFLLSKMLPWI